MSLARKTHTATCTTVSLPSLIPSLGLCQGRSTANDSKNLMGLANQPLHVFIRMWYDRCAVTFSPCLSVASSDPRCVWQPNEAPCNETGVPLDRDTSALLYFNSSSGQCARLSCVDSDTSVDMLFPDLQSCMEACMGHPPVLGGCEGTRYGCCPDGKTPRSKDDSCDDAGEGHPPNEGAHVYACSVRVCVWDYRLIVWY